VNDRTETSDLCSEATGANNGTGWKIRRCPLHEAAPDMLAALKVAVMGLEALIIAAGPPRNNATAIAGHEDALKRVAQGRAAIEAAS
jgi:RecA/RadA recombinase